MIRVQLPEQEALELEAQFRSAGDRAVRDRAQAVLMAHRGRTRADIAADLGVAPRTVQRWLNAYLDGGTAGLRPGKAKGAPAKIPAELAEEVRGWVIGGPAGCGLDRANWTQEGLAEYLGRAKGIRVSRAAVGRFCRKVGIRVYRPTYKHLRGNPVKQEAAKEDIAALEKKRRPANSCC